MTQREKFDHLPSVKITLAMLTQYILEKCNNVRKSNPIYNSSMNINWYKLEKSNNVKR